MRRWFAYLWPFLLCLSVSTLSQTFTDVSDIAGINHVFNVGDVYFGGGVSVIDYNNDDLDDFYITGGFVKDVLYRNNGDGTFTDVTSQSGLNSSDSVVTMGAIAGDIDNDGDEDLFVTVRCFLDTVTYAPNILYLNNGNGTFTDISLISGISNDTSFSTSAAFGDYNIDGYIDIYVLNFIDIPVYDFFDLLRNGFGASANIGKANYLYLNNGDNTFQEVGNLLGVDNEGAGWGVQFTDYDNDSDVDIFVVNDFGNRIEPNTIYQNQYPLDQFLDVGSFANFDIGMFAMGIAGGDYNEDGWLDYYVTDDGPNDLFRNNGDGTFNNSGANAAGVLDYGWTTQNGLAIATGWGTGFFDYDNDTYLDLYVINGSLVIDADTIFNPNSLYKGSATGTFINMSIASGLFEGNTARGSAFSDYDNDGDLDLIVVEQTYPAEFNVPTGIPTPKVKLYKNNISGNNWLKVKLVGMINNKDGVGARIKAVVGSRNFIREVDGGSSVMSNNSKIAHFGLGSSNLIDTIEVTWPGGYRQLVTNVTPNQTITIIEDTVYQVGLPDTIFLCSSDPIVIKPNKRPGYSYLWGTGDSTSSIEINSAANNYTLTVTDTTGGVSSVHQFHIEPLFSNVSLSQDTTICKGDSVTLWVAGRPGHYLWSTGDLSDSVIVKPAETATFKVSVEGFNHCFFQDSLVIAVNPLPEIVPLSDTTICASQCISLLNSTELLDLEETSHTTQTYSTFTLFQSFIPTLNGELTKVEIFFRSVTSTNAFFEIRSNTGTGGSLLYSSSISCSADWCSINLIPPIELTAGSVYTWVVKDSTNAITLKANYNNPYSNGRGTLPNIDHTFKTYMISGIWDPGNFSGSSYNVCPLESSNYNLKVKDRLGCINYDTVEVLIAPSVKILAEDSICSGDSIALSIDFGEVILWNTGDSTDQIWVRPSGNTTYSVSATGLVVGCQSSDTVTITVLPSPIITIIGDSTFCDGDTAVISAWGGDRFHWSTGDTTASIEVLNGGNYNVTVVGQHSCIASDSLMVVKNALPEVTIEEMSIEYCSHESPVNLLGLPPGGSFSGEGVSSDIFDPSIGEGTYLITYRYTNNNNCTNKAEREVTVEQCTNTQQFESSYGLFKVYPNPFKALLIIEFWSHTTDYFPINLINILGEVVYEHKVNLSRGENIISINTSQIPSGFYFLSVKAHSKKFKVFHTE